MCKLLQAGLRRYLKDIPLWICIAVAFLSGAFLGNQIYLMNTPSIDTVCFLVPLLLFSILTSLSLGREFDDGAIRNKIISGHSRASIFFSELILAAASCSTLFFSFFISFAITNIEDLSRVPFEIGVNVWIGCLLLSILSAVLHSVVTLLLSNRTLAIVINLVLVLVFAFIAGETLSALHQNEYTTHTVYEYDENGDVFASELVKEKNPHYVGGSKRIFYEALSDTLPCGQAEEYCDILNTCLQADGTPTLDENESKALKTHPFYSLAATALISLLGWVVFRKRPIK